MSECIPLMETMFRDLAAGRILQPLRNLMRIPDQKGILGMMPAYANLPDTNIIATKLITIFHANHAANYPSHQGIIILFDGNNGTPLMLFDAEEITAIRTAAASAVATKYLANENAATLAIIGTGEQAERHIQSIPLVRNIKDIHLWGRDKHKALLLAQKAKTISNIPIRITDTARQAAENADIVCTVTAATQPVIEGHWLSPGTHLNVTGSCTPNAREVDSNTIISARIFTDRYESLFNEAGDFLIPKKEGHITESHAQAELSEVLTNAKPGRQSPTDITLFKSLGIAAEDLYAAHHIYKKLSPQSVPPTH